jgi:enolase
VTATAIASVVAWEAFDSRGTPTVACEVRLVGGARGLATVPSGASTGAHEAIELRDGGARFAGLGVREAVRNVIHVLGPGIAGLDATEPEQVDRALCALDGTERLGRLGANAVLAVSLAATIAAAEAARLPLYRFLALGEPLLPLPMVNVLSGGAHAAGAIGIQDVLVVPLGAHSFAEAIEWAWRVRRATAEIAAERGLPAWLAADEGGLGIPLPTSRAALKLLLSGIERSGLKPGEDAAIAVDVAASQFASTDSLLEEVVAWTSSFPIVSVEDPLGEDDWDGWAKATRRLDRVQVVGDDLFATDAERVSHGISQGAANAILVKPNQAGTLSGARAALMRAREAGYATIVSARSGDTEEAWLADVAVGWRAGQIKVGSTTRSERTAKWNRLLRIEAELGKEAVFAGLAAMAGMK